MNFNAMLLNAATGYCEARALAHIVVVRVHDLKSIASQNSGPK